MRLVLSRENDLQADTTGFTLVELSVVIAMTAVLTALLLPALSSAKEKSRRAVCQSNQHQLLQIFELYADDNAQYLPSSADNFGYYHSIRLSDETFTNLVWGYAAGNSNIFYCPNIVFGTGPNAVTPHDQNGYIIGYSYLSSDIKPSAKAPDYLVAPTKATDSPTNELIADANYWSTVPTPSSPALVIAPHSPMGAVMAARSSFIVGKGVPSSTVGAAGGNIGFLNGSVSWRYIRSMQTYPASDSGDAYGNW